MPAKKTGRLNADAVLVFLKKRKTVTSTDDIANHFKVGKQQAAASVAILRIKDVVEPATPPKGPDGTSLWRLK